MGVITHAPLIGALEVPCKANYRPPMKFGVLLVGVRVLKIMILYLELFYRTIK